MSARAARRILPPALSLADFIHRSRVLAQYRAFLRALDGVEGAAAVEARTSVRAAFARGAAVTDRADARGLLAEGERELATLRGSTGTVRAGAGRVPPPPAAPGCGGGSSAGSSSSGSGVGSGGSVPGRAPPGAAAALAAAPPLSPAAAAAAIDDVKGRMGQGWPWSR